MRAPIFRSASYLLVVGADSAAFKTAITESCRRHRLHTYFCRDPMELKVAGDAMSRITGLFIFPEKMTQTQISEMTVEFSKRNIPIRLFSSKPLFRSLTIENGKIISSDSASAVAQGLDELLHELVPPSLEPALMDDANKILPLFLEKVPQLKTVKSVGFDFDRQLNFSLVAGNIVGLGVFRVKLSAIDQLLPKDKRANGLEHFQEAMNQWIGSVAARMSTLGMNAIVGLPTWFDTSTIPELQTLVYFPSVHIVADSHFAVSVGFVDLTGAKLSLEGIDKAVK